ncbi:hypothetical protein H6F96_21170 [Microcoleus sp. FACHB-53]|nr:hypothetical protein [Microcoleus sp. FACHB-53]MBD2129384.1 hypothetical protein [Microcoleus sp. FACHB-1]
MLEAIENAKEAATFAAVGAVVGGVVYHQIGGAGLAIAGGHILSVWLHLQALVQ